MVPNKDGFTEVPLGLLRKAFFDHVPNSKDVKRAVPLPEHIDEEDEFPTPPPADDDDVPGAAGGEE